MMKQMSGTKFRWILLNSETSDITGTNDPIVASQCGTVGDGVVVIDTMLGFWSGGGMVEEIMEQETN